MADATSRDPQRIPETSAHARVLIVGAGHAGVQLAIQLRQAGYPGSIAVLSQELELPYQRPPLSKDYLKGKLTVERLPLRPKQFYQENDIQLELGAVVTAVHPDRRHLVMQDGRSLDYGVLVLATGATPRRLPDSLGSGAAQACVLRDLVDADRLKKRLRSGDQGLVVGAGYIGLEVAAAMRESGMSVTVVELQEQVLARVAGAKVADHIAQLHRDHGVKLQLGAQLQSLEALGDGRVVATLGDKVGLVADVVVAGVGVVANDALARAAGLACDAAGIIVDEDCRTQDPVIYAIGDCAVRPLPTYGRSLRLESVPSAVEQARLVAHHIAGRPRPPVEVPWFWTEQFGQRLQTVGLCAGHDEALMCGNSSVGRFAVYYLKRNRLLAVDAVNSVEDFQYGKRHVGCDLTEDQLSQLHRRAAYASGTE